MMEEGEDRVKASCRENYARLVSIKKKYDPTNLFRSQHQARLMASPRERSTT
jgi:FAD/FMN-containing dehydrogenase